MDCRNLRDRPRGLPPPLPKLLKGGKSNYSCRRVSGRLPGESLRKLRPSSRSAGSYEHGRETGQWHRNDTSRLARGCGDAEVVPTRMKRPIRGMQGQATADERLLKAGGSPLSSMSPENRRRVTTDTPALLIKLVLMIWALLILLDCMRRTIRENPLYVRLKFNFFNVLATSPLKI